MSNNVNEIANKKTRKPLAKKEFSLKDFKKKINGEDIPQDRKSTRLNSSHL